MFGLLEGLSGNHFGALSSELGRGILTFHEPTALSAAVT